ncbi:serine/threonine-protein kinase [Acanthopleuribacter pedis]|uniref:Serine/threonine protein kinase n=1 Tax=Acanthopleuribacter pedis TaxID=442870 RepID=A0A8J7U700_9BACT|nr:serine/threonine-protein kinase [Acanthopleuribacter pedis]MBO1320901.1 serine/threonine protein kinase [Acanthopleuribacter pedis]
METIRHYKILNLVGRGGFGDVYQAFDDKLKRYVALKVIRTPDEVSLSADNRQRFYQEGKISGKLDHENIAAIYEMGEWEGRAFLVMEWIEGRTLDSVIRRHDRLSLTRVIDYMLQIRNGLAFAHEHNVAHLDIKPTNIMVTAQNRIKILDFGVARMLEHSGLTRQGFEGFTPWYAAPEQERGDKADHRGDVYAVGVVFHELLTGALPQISLDTRALSEEMFPERDGGDDSDIGVPSQNAPDSSVRPLDLFFYKALHPEPDKRYQSVETMFDDLSKILADLENVPDYRFSSTPDFWKTPVTEQAFLSMQKTLRGAPSRFSKGRLKLVFWIFCLTVAGGLWPLTRVLLGPSNDGLIPSSPRIEPAHARQRDGQGGLSGEQPADKEPEEAGEVADAISQSGDHNISQSGDNNTVIGRDLNIFGQLEPAAPKEGLDIRLQGNPGATGSTPSSKPRTKKRISGNPNLRTDLNADVVAKEVERLAALVDRYQDRDPDKALFYQGKIVELLPEDTRRQQRLFEMMRASLPDLFTRSDLAALLKRFPDKSRPLLLEADQRAWRARCLPPTGKIVDFLLLSDQNGTVQRGRGRLSGRHFWINGRRAEMQGSLEYHYSPNLSPYDRFQYLHQDGKFAIETGYSTELLPRAKFARMAFHDHESQRSVTDETLVFSFDVVLLTKGATRRRNFLGEIPMHALLSKSVVRLNLDLSFGRDVFLIHEAGFPLSFSDRRHNIDFHSGRRLTRNRVSRLRDIDLFVGSHIVIVLERVSDAETDFKVHWSAISLSTESKIISVREEGVFVDDTRHPYKPMGDFFGSSANSL